MSWLCGGWRDPETIGSEGGSHLNVHIVEAALDGLTRIHDYWCAGGFDPEEPLVLAFSDGRHAPIRVAALDPPSDPWVARVTPHLRPDLVEVSEMTPEPGACIRSGATDAVV
jgi:hypothetical protein